MTTPEDTELRKQIAELFNRTSNSKSQGRSDNISEAMNLITLHTKKADTKARIDEHSQLWDIVPSFTEHVETVQDISDLRVFKLEAQLTNPTERSEQ